MGGNATLSFCGKFPFAMLRWPEFFHPLISPPSSSPKSFDNHNRTDQGGSNPFRLFWLERSSTPCCPQQKKDEGRYFRFRLKLENSQNTRRGGKKFSPQSRLFNREFAELSAFNLGCKDFKSKRWVWNCHPENKQFFRSASSDSELDSLLMCTQNLNFTLRRKRQKKIFRLLSWLERKKNYHPRRCQQAFLFKKDHFASTLNRRPVKKGFGGGENFFLRRK